MQTAAQNPWAACVISEDLIAQDQCKGHSHIFFNDSLIAFTLSQVACCVASKSGQSQKFKDIRIVGVASVHQECSKPRKPCLNKNLNPEYSPVFRVCMAITTQRLAAEVHSFSHSKARSSWVSLNCSHGKGLLLGSAVLRGISAHSPRSKGLSAFCSCEFAPLMNQSPNYPAKLRASCCCGGLIAFSSEKWRLLIQNNEKKVMRGLILPYKSL